MGILSAAELLDIWERGLDQPLVSRILALLVAASPQSNADELAALPIGWRNSRLLQLREGLFGPKLTLMAPCPSCGEHLESTFHVANILCDADPAADKGGLTEELQRSILPRNVRVDGYSFTFRLLASSDLLALSSLSVGVSPRRALLARCLLEAQDSEGAAVEADALPEQIVAAVAAQMSKADPQAEVTLALACPSCAHHWEGIFDIADFLWKEIHAWAQSLLRDVHCLARVYGWREADVLALSPTRRQVYLELSRQ